MRKLYLIYFILFLFSASFTYAVGLESYDLFTTDLGREIGSYDAKTFVNRPIYMEIAQPNANNIMVACFKYDNPACDELDNYDECFAISEYYKTKCEEFDPWLIGRTTVISSAVYMHDMPVSSPKKTCADATFYTQCGGVGIGQRYLVTQKQYRIYSHRKFDCDNGDPSWFTYDAEGLYPGYENDYNDEISCPTGTICSEEFDDQWESHYSRTIPNPCKNNDWDTCTEDSQCSSGKCIDGKCSPCNSRQCAVVSDEICIENGELDASEQFYCDSNSLKEILAECSSSENLGCEVRGNYYCTYQDLQWKWRQCTLGYGCVDGACITDILSISVTPDLLEFEV